MVRRRKAESGEGSSGSVVCSEADAGAVMSARAVPRRPRRGEKARAKGRRKSSLMESIRQKVVPREEKQVPEYLIFNRYILSGYRVNFSAKDSLLSLFTWHNETLNIWTHVLGFILFFCLFLAWACYAPPVREWNGHLHAIGQRWSGHDNSAGGAGASSTNYYDGGDPMEPLVLLRKARSQLGKKLHLDEMKDHLRKILQDVEHMAIAEDSDSDIDSTAADKVKQGLRQSLKYLKQELKRRNVGKHLHMEELKRKLLEVETQVVNVISKNFKVEYWPLYLYLVGAMCCMFCSSMAHTFSICSPKANKWWWRIDYVGIAIMITSSFCPLIYYVFLEEVLWRTVYLVSILFLGTVVACVSLLEIFQSDELRVLRTWLFVGLALFAIFPLFHACVLFTGEGAALQVVVYELVMGALYLTGAMVYAIQFPESKFPGKFDLVLNSHNLFHVAIVVAAYFHYVAVMKCLDWRYGMAV
jgi:adiponectin receptor